MNHAASNLENRYSKELYKMEGFYRQKKGRIRKLLAKEKNCFSSVPSPLLQGEKVSSLFKQITSCQFTEKCTT